MILAALIDAAFQVGSTLPPSAPAEIVAAAAPAPTPDDTLSGLLAPGGALTLVLGTIWFSAREFRKGRELRVREAEEGEEQARTRQTAAEVDRDRVTGELRTKLGDVERQLVELREEMRRTLEAQEIRHREEMRAQENRHRRELAEARAREEMTNSENWRLRTLLTRRGYDPDTGEPIRERMAEDEHGAGRLDTASPVPGPTPVPPVPPVDRELPGAVHRVELHDRGIVRDAADRQDDDEMGV